MHGPEMTNRAKAGVAGIRHVLHTSNTYVIIYNTLNPSDLLDEG